MFATQFKSKKYLIYLYVDPITAKFSGIFQ